MNRLSKIAYAFLIVILLFLLPVTYANSSVIVSIIKDEKPVSSAEAGSVVTVQANVENPNEGDIVTFNCTNSTLSFINEQTGKEYGEGEEVKKEIFIDKDGKGIAEVSAKVLTDAQIEVNATVAGLDPEGTEDPNLKATDESGKALEDTNSADNEAVVETQDQSGSTEQVQPSEDQKTGENLSPETQSDEQNVTDNSTQNASDPQTIDVKPDDSTQSVPAERVETEQKQGVSAEEQEKSDQNTEATPEQADSDQKTQSDPQAGLDKQSKTDEQVKTDQESVENVLTDTEDTQNDKNSNSDQADDPQKDTTDSNSLETDNENQSGEETVERKLKIVTDSLSVKTGDTVSLEASIQPETETKLLENVIWTISYSNKEIIPDGAKGSEVQFEVPEDASGRLITVSAYIPKEDLKTEDDLRAKNITLGALSNKISVGIYPSTDSKVIQPGVDIGFSTEILDGEYVADSSLSENAKYRWFAQLDNSYLNGTSFGTTYSVRPVDQGELKVWVSVTLNNGSIIESEPVVKTVADQESVTLESIKIYPKDQVKQAYTNDEVVFTRDLVPTNATNLEGCTYQWIAKMGDVEIAKSDEEEFNFLPVKEGDYSITLTITPKEDEPVVSEPYQLNVLANPDSDEQKIQMIPENQVDMDTETDLTDKTIEDSEKPENTVTETSDDTKESQNPDKTEQQDKTSTSGNKSVQNISTPDNPLKLLGAEIVTQNDVNNLEVGKALRLDANIKTEGGSGEVVYSWKATDAEGKVVAESNKLDNFTFTVDKPTDVTVVFEVGLKNPGNVPDQNKNARAERTFSFKSSKAVAQSISSGSKNNPDSRAIDSNDSNLVAENIKPIGTPVATNQNSSSATTQSVNKSTPSQSNTSGSNTTQSTGNSVGNSSKSNSSTPSLKDMRNDSSSKAVGSTPTGNNTESKFVSSNTSKAKSNSSASPLADFRKATNPEPSSATLSTDDASTKTTKRVPQDNAVVEGIKDALATPSPFINPRTGDPFTIAEVGTVVILLVAAGCIIYSLIKSKDENSNDYYL